MSGVVDVVILDTQPVVSIDPQVEHGAVGTNDEQFDIILLSHGEGNKEHVESNNFHVRSGPQNHLDSPPQEQGSSSSIGGHKHPTAPTSHESIGGKPIQVHPSGHVLLRVIV
jgi:hypothetical protein